MRRVRADTELVRRQGNWVRIGRTADVIPSTTEPVSSDVTTREDDHCDREQDGEDDQQDPGVDEGELLVD